MEGPISSLIDCQNHDEGPPRLHARAHSNGLLQTLDSKAMEARWYLGTAANRDALRALDGLADGAFVIRVSKTLAHSYVLSFR